MRSVPLAVAFAAMFVVAVPAISQQGTPPPGPSAGQGPGAGPRPGPGIGRDFTPGWAMMTAAEREAHRQQMMNATSAEECRRIRDDHLKLMAERARGRGMANMPIGRRDACAKLAP